VQQIALPQQFELPVRQVGERLRVDLGRIASGGLPPAIGIESACSSARCVACRRDHWRQA
jgi:hypothetical protein